MSKKVVSLLLVALLLVATIVVPVNAAVGSEYICTATVASADGMYTYSGSTTFANSKTSAYNATAGYYYGNIAGCWMQMSINAPATSTYKVSIYNPLAHTGNDAAATIVVTHGTTTETFPVNLQTAQGWMELGNYSLDSGEAIVVKMVCNTSGRNIRFDTVRLIEIGNKPLVTNAKIMDKGALDEPLTALYDYVDPAGNPEGNTTFAWYSSDTEDGTYTQISGATGQTYTPVLADSYKYIKAAITPASTSQVGEAFDTNPVLIQWKLDFNDDFDQPNPDGYTDSWISDNGPMTHTLSGRYPENTYIADGKINFVTKQESRNGQDWTCGGVKSIDDFHYGYYECSFKYASGYGMNQSFWIMTRTGNQRPGDYEIDINEGHWPNKVASNYHYYVDDVHMSNAVELTYPYSFSDDYHTWGAAWDEEGITMYLDGVEYRRMDNTEWANARGAAIYLTNAVVSWSGTVGDTIDGQVMSVDFVRRYLPIDDTKASLPYATNVSIPTDDVSVGDTLQVSYDYNSVEGITEDGSEYKWLRTGDLDVKDWEVVATGTTSASAAPSYELTEDDWAKYLVCAIKANNDERDGQYVYSNVIEVYTPEMAPVANDVVLYGDYRPGGTINGSYAYFDINSDTEAGSTYAFVYGDTADAASWTTFASGDAASGDLLEANVPAAALGKYVKLVVTPKNNGETPNVGAETSSNVIGPIASTMTQDNIIRTSTVSYADYSLTSGSDTTITVSRTGAYDSVNGYYYLNGKGKWAAHNVTVPKSSVYKVYVYHPLLNANNDLNTTVTVNYAGGGSYSMNFNARTTEAGWIELGDFPFVTTQPAVITMTGSGNGNVRLDTVRLVNMSASPVYATDLSIGGNMIVGGSVSADYTFNGGTEGNSNITWYASAQASGPWTQIGTGASYTLTENEAEKYLKFTVSPVSSTGETGTVKSFVSSGTVASNTVTYTSTVSKPGYSITTNGTLNTSFTSPYNANAGYYFIRAVGEWAAHNVTLAQSGLYTVKIYNPLMHETNDVLTGVEVTYADGQKYDITFNGRTTPAGWMTLGNFPFDASEPAVVTFKTGTFGGNVRVDTVQFTYVGEDAAVSASDLSISGTMMAGSTLTADYTFNGGTEGSSIITWYTSASAAGPWTVGGTGSSYTPTETESSKYVKYTVRPIAASGAEGIPAMFVSAGTVQTSMLYYTATVAKAGYTVTTNKVTLTTSTTGAYTTSGYYYMGTLNDWVKQVVTLPSAGTYKVSYYQPLAHTGNTNNALIKVTDVNGATQNSYNFQTVSGWIELGNFTFDSTAEVLTTVGTTGNIRVDTLRFEKIN